jgi:oligosaccharide repeat unit polymerase
MMLIARWVCGRWFNHLSLYSFVWSVSVLALQSHLIAYHAVVPEAWFHIFVAWLAIYAGTAIFRLASPPAPVAKREFPNLNMSRLRDVILVFSLAGFASTAVLAVNIVRRLNLGLILALMQQANQIYSLRFNGEVSGLTYVVFLPYAGCVLAGIYAARLGRVTLIGTMPLVAMLLDGIVSMQRAGILYGILLFSFSYFFTPKSAKLLVPTWQKIAVTGAALLAFLLVTFHRGGTPVYAGEQETLVRAGDVVSILPPLYLYASGPIVCFSEYLKHPEEDGKDLWGRYMFASIYRFLSKFGADTYVPYYQHFYNTPIPVNTGTYLREIYADFGAVGIFAFPFTLGLVIPLLEAGSRGTFSVIALSFLYVVIALSFTLNFVGSGGWYFPIPIALLVTSVLKVPEAGRAGRHLPARFIATAS